MSNDPIVPVTNQVSIYKADDDFADMRAQDRISPRIVLMQALSPAVNAGKINQGEFGVSDQCILKRGEKLKFIPLMWWFQWTEFNPDANCPKEKRVLARSVDANSDLAIAASRYEEVTNSKGQKVQRVTESFNFALLIPAMGGWDTIYTTTFQRSAHKVGKTFLNRLKSMKNSDFTQMPMFSHMFELSSEFIDKGADKKYFAPVIGGHTEVPEGKIEELKNVVMALKAQRAAFIAREMERAEEHEENPTSPQEAKDMDKKSPF